MEAALFMSSKSLSIEEIAKLLGIGSIGHVKNIADSLVKEYEKRNCSIYISIEDSKYIMRIKEKYYAVVSNYAKEMEISSHALKTLAFISKNDGILKSNVVKQLGTTVYLDVKELCENGFLIQKKRGRTSALFITQKFKDYFKEKTIN